MNLDLGQGQNVLSHVAAAVYSCVTSSHLTACLALLLCTDVDGGLVDACERVVPRIVPGGKKSEKPSLYLKKLMFVNISNNRNCVNVDHETAPRERFCDYTKTIHCMVYMVFLAFSTYTEQYGLFLWLTKLLAVRTILQTSQ